MENVQGYYENTVDEIQTKADIFQEKFITGTLVYYKTFKFKIAILDIALWAWLI